MYSMLDLNKTLSKAEIGRPIGIKISNIKRKKLENQNPFSRPKFGIYGSNLLKIKSYREVLAS